VRSITVLYDDDCGFCRWSADRIRRVSRRRVQIVTIQSQRGQFLLREVPADRRLDSMHAVTADGRVWPAGAAVPWILRAVPGGRPLAALAARFPGATERLYRAIANRRESFGRLLGEEACEIDPARGRTP
jgi:predicted DCC family thiol-disulfide oxidoreductase YuxK